MPPLIAHIILRLDIGGLENGLVNLINGLPRDAYRHAVICLKDYSDFRHRIERADVEVFALHKREGKDIGVYARLRRLLRCLRPAIVHTRNLAALDSALVAHLAGVPHRLHSEHGWDMPDLHGTRFKYRLLRRVCDLSISRYIALSRDIENWLRHTIGVSAGKLTHIYNGVDSARFHPTDDRYSLRRAMHVFPHMEDVVIIGTVGRMEAVKDSLALVRAFVHLLDTIPVLRRKLRLLMIGDGPLRTQAQTLLKSAQVADFAYLPGARNDIPELLRCMDIFVLPSLNEGISNTVLEAMATSLPVIASAVGGNPELVVPGVTGMLVPAADTVKLAAAIQTYVDQPEQRAQHGHAGRERVERLFSLPVMLKTIKPFTICCCAAHNKEPLFMSEVPATQGRVAVFDDRRPLETKESENDVFRFSCSGKSTMDIGAYLNPKRTVHQAALRRSRSRFPSARI